MIRLVQSLTTTVLILCCLPSAGSQGDRPKSSESDHAFPIPFEQGAKWGYADANGIVVISPQFEKARNFADGLAAVYVRTAAPSKIGFIDSRGAGTPAVREVKKWGFIDNTGKMVIAPEFEGVGEFSEGLASASRQIPVGEDTWGYINKEGKMVIKPKFSAAAPFSEGLALVRAGGMHLTDSVLKDFVKMGYIDKTGRWLIESRLLYFFYDSFSEGAVPFRKNGGKWGYMNKKGVVFIWPRFDWAGNFSQGLAPALISGSCAHIDKSGNVVDQSPLPDTGQKRRHGTYTWHPHPPPCQ
ncbi:MAG: WG repeat-containing protein [Terriglobales bacterium]